MPQVLAIVLVGAVIWYAWRALKREMNRVDSEVRGQESKKTIRDVTPLEKDKDGVYRPKKEG
jgi:hypothetical protein